MSDNEKYNPKIHCCRYWYKDFCECTKKAKKESMDRNVNGTLYFLKKNKIDYIESKIPNVVIINPKSDRAFLSLKKEKGYLFKCKFIGCETWYKFGKNKFLKRFIKKQVISDREKVTKLELIIQNYINEHRTIVTKEGWDAGKFKRVIIKDINRHLNFLFQSIIETL